MLKEPFRINRRIAYAMLALGLCTLGISAIYAFSTFAFVGLGLTFWGALLLYVTPAELIVQELLNATTYSILTNVEKLMTETGANQKGIYLPPKYLKDLESSSVFIPSKADQPLPRPDNTDEMELFSEDPNGIFLTPPGMALARIVEKECRMSFLRTSMSLLREKLPKAFVEDLGLAQDMDIKMENNTITIEITNHAFTGICEETRKLRNVHESMGCLLSSTIACVLAKSTGKPVTISKEEQSSDGKITRIQFNVLED